MKYRTYLNGVQELIRYLPKSSFSIHCLRRGNFGLCTKLNKLAYNHWIFTYSLEDVCRSAKQLGESNHQIKLIQFYSLKRIHEKSKHIFRSQTSIEKSSSDTSFTCSLYDRPSLVMAAAKIFSLSPLAR